MVGAGFSLRINFLNLRVFRTLKGAATSNNPAHKNNLTKSGEESGKRIVSRHGIHPKRIFWVEKIKKFKCNEKPIDLSMLNLCLLCTVGI